MQSEPQINTHQNDNINTLVEVKLEVIILNKTSIK